MKKPYMTPKQWQIFWFLNYLAATFTSLGFACFTQWKLDKQEALIKECEEYRPEIEKAILEVRGEQR